jgi:hypothetical protein
MTQAIVVGWNNWLGLGSAAGAKVHAVFYGLLSAELLYSSKLGAGWSSLAARRAHNPKVVGSNPTPATTIWLFSKRFSTQMARKTTKVKSLVVFFLSAVYDLISLNALLLVSTSFKVFLAWDICARLLIV